MGCYMGGAGAVDTNGSNDGGGDRSSPARNATRAHARAHACAAACDAAAAAGATGACEFTFHGRDADLPGEDLEVRFHMCAADARACRAQGGRRRGAPCSDRRRNATGVVGCKLGCAFRLRLWETLPGLTRAGMVRAILAGGNAAS